LPLLKFQPSYNATCKDYYVPLLVVSVILDDEYKVWNSSLWNWIEHSFYATCFTLRSTFLSAFAKFRKSNISFIMSVCLPVCLSVRMEQLGYHWTDFYEIWYLSISRKSVDSVQFSLQSDKKIGYCTRRPACIYHNITLNPS